CWENGIILCRELADQYESYYDYRNLSKMRNKEFVCRGHDYERLEAFQQRMLNEFPHAIAMQHVNQPDQTIYQADAQCILGNTEFIRANLQIYAVTPIPESQDVLQRDGVPDNIKSFYKFNHIWRFRYDRPFHKGTKDKENEFKSLWVERTTLTLVQSLPGISRWFEVEKRELVEVSPLENAIEVIENKNLQLRTLITQCQSRQMQNINPLTMCLNGVIDAAVNGGLARYQEAFRCSPFCLLAGLFREGLHHESSRGWRQDWPTEGAHAHILEYGLTVHEKYVPQDMRPLHKKLVDQFHLMKSSFVLPLNSISPFSPKMPKACIQLIFQSRGIRNSVPCFQDCTFDLSLTQWRPRAPAHQIGDTTLPRSDPNLSAPDKGRPKDLRNNSAYLFLLMLSAVGPLCFMCACLHDFIYCVIPLSERKHHSSNFVPSLIFGLQFPLPKTQGRSPRVPCPDRRKSLVSNSPVLSGSYSSGISSLSRCSVSEASGTELPTGDHPPHPLPPPSALPNSISSSSDEPIRRENKTPPPYSVYERNNPRRPVPLPHSLSIPPQTDPPALPPKPHQLRTGSIKLDGNADPRVPRPRPLPRKVSQL
ncbi:hypothetical protein XENOCAPTIV_001147, partial [Xenoophorus captivus]